MSSPYIGISKAVEFLVDRRFGVVRNIYEKKHVAGTPDILLYVAEAANTKVFVSQSNFRVTAGAGGTRERALAKAIGEAVERYCAAIYSLHDLPFCTAKEAPFQYIRPELFALYTEEQYASPNFPYAPFSIDTPVTWTPARTLAGKVYFIPAAMVYIPYHYRENIELPIVQPISTGLACHQSFEEAALNAACEVIERDAFMIVWQKCLSPPQIRLDSVGSTNIEMLKRFSLPGTEVRLFDITLDTSIPTILATQLSTNARSPGLVVAAATAMNSDVAVQKALEELSLTAAYMEDIARGELANSAVSLSSTEVVDQFSHLKFWCDHSNLKLAEFLFESKEKKALDEIGRLQTDSTFSDLKMIAERLQNRGYDLLLSELTTSDIAEVGLSVVRAVIPGFHPLAVGHNQRVLGGRRLHDIPERLPWLAWKLSRNELNHAPHPYP